ncbi:uncharacterized protein LOC120270558 [Dioscorea cayenensis subsp. rotundata]|uniref:Uncharacterized protein LOC120270558 n=1 Tax=Dioscorea cayennensis subsp. rotundata TaxID=55577 RepID=A0AB40C436_DIOCR|nr:uncharacterized protein LOC120270558 [Dioscorea cayenensis subsp. rotundata]
MEDHPPICQGRRARAVAAIALITLSPIILPLICFSFPILCIAFVCARLRRHEKQSPTVVVLRGEDVRRCEEGMAGVGLLDRYLDDQLGLVVSVFDCADDRSGASEIL